MLSSTITAAKMHSVIIAQDPEKVSIYLDESISGLNLPNNILVIRDDDFQSGGKYNNLPNPITNLKNLRPFLLAYADRLKFIALKKQMNRFIQHSVSLNPTVETEELSKTIENVKETPEHQAAYGFYDVAAKLAE